MNENPFQEQTPSAEWDAPTENDYDESEELPKMSLGATLANIFFSPAQTFLALRGVPRFVVAGLIIVVMPLLFQFAATQKIGIDRLATEQFKANPMTENMSPEERKIAIENSKSPAVQSISYVAIAIFIILYLVIGGFLYWGIINAAGGQARYSQSLSAWTYGAFPPIVLKILLGFVILLLSSVDDLNFDYLNDYFVTSSPAFLFDSKTQPVLHAAMKNFDIFSFLSVFLGALGLQKVGRIAPNKAWGVSIAFWLFALMGRIAWAAFVG